MKSKTIQVLDDQIEIATARLNVYRAQFDLANDSKDVYSQMRLGRDISSLASEIEGLKRFKRRLEEAGFE